MSEIVLPDLNNRPVADVVRELAFDVRVLQVHDTTTHDELTHLQEQVNGLAKLVHAQRLQLDAALRTIDSLESKGRRPWLG